MIVCFEGPDFAGKSTTIHNILSSEKFNSEVRALGIKEIRSFHFPNTSESKSSYHVWNCINNSKCMHDTNPYYQIMAFFTDFYATLNYFGKEVLFSYIGDNSRLLILDRYYYSSLIMCPYWESTDKYITKTLGITNDTIIDKDMSNMIVEIKNEIQKYAIDSVGKMELPPPDLNIVLLPSYELIVSRSKKRNATDINEKEEKIKENYFAYRNAASLDMMRIFGSNHEPLPPVIIRSSNITIPSFDSDELLTNFSRIVNYQEFFDANKIAKQCGNMIIKLIGLYKSKRESKDVPYVGKGTRVTNKSEGIVLS